MSSSTAFSNLYHGSTTQYLLRLEPRRRYTPAGKIEYAAIYATPLKAYAAAHAFPWSSDEGIGLSVIDDEVHMSIPETLRERLSMPISIYTLPMKKNDFIHTEEESTGYTWHTTKPIEVEHEDQYTSVLEAFEELGVRVEWV